MPSAFEAAHRSAPSIDALRRSASPIKVELPPEGVGPLELRQAAANGDARAQFEVAAIYTEGRAVPQDYAAAANWYERAAAQGFVPAQYRLGNLYENGKGVEKDLERPSSGTSAPPKPATAWRCTTSPRSMPAASWASRSSNPPPSGSRRPPTAA